MTKVDMRQMIQITSIYAYWSKAAPATPFFLASLYQLAQVSQILFKWLIVEMVSCHCVEKRNKKNRILLEGHVTSGSSLESKNKISRSVVTVALEGQRSEHKCVSHLHIPIKP